MGPVREGLGARGREAHRVRVLTYAGAMGRRLALALFALAACARRPAPVEPSERALFRDSERQVTVTSATGWRVDRYEIDGLVNAAMDSTCRVDGFDCRGLLAWLDAEIPEARAARCRSRGASAARPR